MADSNPTTNSPAQVVRQLGEIWGRQSRGKKGVAVGVVALVLGGVLFTSLTHKASTYEAFATQTPEQASSIKNVLDLHHIPSRITKDGTLEVEADRMDEAVTQAGTAGLLSNESGLERFDHPDFGGTTTQEQVKYQQGMQGELTRSIKRMAQVEDARVSIAFGHHSPFPSQESPPSASVMVRLHGGQVLTRSQVEGMKALVAAAVTGLKPDRVVVVDNHGNPLDSTEGTLDKKGANERDVSDKVRRMLETSVGSGHVKVVATADVDERKILETQENFDKDKQAVRTSQRTVEGGAGGTTAAQGAPTTSGVAGTAGNLPGNIGAGAGGGGSGASRLQETMTYDTTNSRLQIEHAGMTVTRLHLAVLVDTKKDKDGKDLERDKDEMAKLAAIAREAAGLDDKRGDKLEMYSVPFAPESDPLAAAATPPVEAPTASFAGLPMEYIQLGGLGLGALVVLVLVASILRGKKKAAKAAAKTAELEAMSKLPQLAFPTPVAELERVLEARPVHSLDKPTESLGLPEGQKIQDRVIEIVSQDVQRAAEVLSAWLAEPPPKGAKP